MTQKRKRCANGTRYNKKSNRCDPFERKGLRCEFSGNRKRCQRSTRCNKKTGKCDKFNGVVVQEREPELPARKSPAPVISRRSEKQNELTRKNQGKKLNQFMRKHNIAQQKSKFLNSICSDSGVCIAFGGRASKIIKHFFKGFTGFDYVDSITSIGGQSSNGFLCSVNYVRESYKAHAVLKSSARKDSDNLMYEYAVGMEINKLFYDKYPVFVETYQCYRYESEMIWEAYIRKKYHHQSLKDALVPYKEIDFEASCADAKFICVLIQHIDKAPTFQHELPKMKVSEILNVLYQIYFTLSAISTSYTHYDLHDNNVLLYTPVKNKFIQYHFHTESGDTISFKSCYIVKIIDYGRCFVKPFSKDAEIEVCNAPSCRPDCGIRRGYLFNNKLREYSIESSVKNESHDLRLLKTLQDDFKSEFRTKGTKFNSTSHKELYKNLLERIRYDDRFGTPEELDSGLTNRLDTTRINNVTDASTVLQELVSSHEEENDQLYVTQTKLGDLHVYYDGRNMKYTPA